MPSNQSLRSFRANIMARLMVNDVRGPISRCYSLGEKGTQMRLCGGIDRAKSTESLTEAMVFFRDVVEVRGLSIELRLGLARWKG